MAEDQALPPNQQPGAQQFRRPGSSSPVRVTGGGGPKGKTKEKRTFWDWLQVVIIPITVVIVAAGLGYWQNNLSMNLAADQQRETAINNYLNSMSTLLMNQDLRSATAMDGSDLRSLARAQTLTVLIELDKDGSRKARVVNFLHDENLINRGTPTMPFPIVNLARADLSGATLSGIDLGGADLTQVNLTGADLSGADLMGADLDQAILTGANLKGAMLDYAQLVGAYLNCANQNNNCTDLTNADLSGADFIGANLMGAVYSNTDVSGTSPQNSFTGAINSKSAYKTTWNVTLKISYNRGDLISVYGILDMSSGKLQVIYGPLGNGGTSVVLFPAFWSYTSCPGDYCQNAPVTGGTYTSLLPRDNSPIPGELQQNRPLSFTIVGTIADLTVTDTITFSIPGANSIEVDVNASATSIAPITLDQFFRGTKNNLNREAFKPVILTAMYDSSSIWTAQQAVFGKQKPLTLNDTNTRIPSPTQPPTQQTSFTLIGGTSSSVTNAPKVSVSLTSLLASRISLMSMASATLQVQQNNNASVDNVNMWDGVDAPNSTDKWSYPDHWSYTVVASVPY